jgi:hypothetical protein
MLLCAVVLAVALLSFYVHVLNEHMLRAQGLRTAGGAPLFQTASERPHLRPGSDQACATGLSTLASAHAARQPQGRACRAGG